MSDDTKKGEVYLVQVKGAAARLVRATDARLARKHVLAGIYPPEIEVRRPTTDEAMDMAVDGVRVEEADAGAPAPDPKPDLNDPPRVNPDDDADDSEAGLPLGDA